MRHGRAVDHSSWGKGIRSSRSRDFARMENRWSCPANEPGASGRCRLGRGSHFGEGGSLENRRRHSRSVSGRTATGAGKGRGKRQSGSDRSEEHTSELQSLTNLVCRLLLEKKK